MESCTAARTSGESSSPHGGGRGEGRREGGRDRGRGGKGSCVPAWRAVRPREPVVSRHPLTEGGGGRGGGKGGGIEGGVGRGAVCQRGELNGRVHV